MPFTLIFLNVWHDISSLEYELDKRHTQQDNNIESRGWTRNKCKASITTPNARIREKEIEKRGGGGNDIQMESQYHGG